ncbi:tetratricopeptide repeat protein [Planctomycetales bacterium ZRK34]|nr:tetratricopeptide repeat protein [Planctomycetales bacterium ZRK34]
MSLRRTSSLDVFYRGLTIGVLSVGLGWLGGCSNADKTAEAGGKPDQSDQLAAAVEAEAAAPAKPFDLTLPAPPSIEPEQIQPRAGAALQRAAMTLDQVVAGLTPPDYLQTAGPPQPETDPEADPAEPPAAALKAYVLGRTAFREGNRWEAITQLEQARRLDPNAPEILRLLGSIYFSYGNEVKGAQRLTEAVRLDREDGQSLFLLGRFAFKKSDWDEAIYTLARSAEFDGDQLDPAIEYLRPYYLGQALLQRGYDAAAVESLTRYLSLPENFTRISTLVRELALLDRQRGRVHMQTGDALCRLGLFDRALEYFHAASGDELIEASELTPRRVYCLLAMHRPRAAQQTLIDQLRDAGESSASLELAPYVADHIDNRKQFVKLLRDLYEQTDRPSSLILATAQLAEPAEAQRLLTDHLAARPRDMVVYRRLVDRLVEKNRDKLAALMVKLVSDQPREAADYVAEVLKRDNIDTAALLKQVDALPSNQRDTAAAWYVRGALHEREGKIEIAASDYDKAASLDRGFLTPQVATIDLQIRLGRFDKALELLDKVENPDDPDIRFTRARVLGEKEDLDGSLKIIEDLLQQDPRNIRYRLFKSQLQIAAKDFDEAERTLWSVLDIDPTNEPTYTLLFDLYENNPRTDNTQWIRLMKQVQHEIPASRIARLKMAEWYAANRQYDRAEQNLRDLLRENPGDVLALRTIVQLFNETDRLGEAETLLNETLEQRPDDLAPLILLEQIAIKQGTLDQFYPRKEAYYLRQKESAEQQMALADLYFRWDKKDKAVEALEKALAMKPDLEPKRRMSLAVLYRQLEQYDKAQQQIDLALKAGPEKPADLYYIKALIYHSMDKPDLGEKALLNALKADPDHAPSNNDLGYLWGDEGRNLEQALTMTQKAVASEPENGAYLDSLGWVLYKLGRFEDSRRRLEEARTKPQGNDPVILDHLGDALWRANQKPRALQLWNDALNLARQADPKQRPETVELIDSLSGKVSAAGANREPAIAPVPGEKPPDPTK